MKPVTFDSTCYRIDGQSAYFNTGEFHYFRVPKAHWRKRMRLLKDAGGNGVATYIPWLIHEPSEGRFVFDGADHLQLEEYLQTAADEGLYVVARPGPYQYSELIFEGLPRWLCEGYPEILARNLEGKVLDPSVVSYLHPVFLEKARRWFDAVCPILARYTVSRGGPIAFTQIDNEMGQHIWYGSLDYNAEAMGLGKAEGRWPSFLAARYGDLAAVNEAYATSYQAIEDVRPVPPSAATDVPALRCAKDYFDFYTATLGEYGAIMAEMMRDHGIDTPLMHNAANPSMAVYFTDMVERLSPELLLGGDHYYNLDQTWTQNNPTPQYATRCFTSCEILRMMGMPPTVLELPGGSYSDWPPVTAHDASVSYMLHLALGMKGHNYYIFTGGPNVPGTGVTTDIYDFCAGVGADGEIRPLYHAQKAFGQFIADRPWLAEAKREGDFRVAMDFDMARAYCHWHADVGLGLTGSDAWDFLHRGLLTTAMCGSLSPIFCNLGSDDWLAETDTPVAIVCSAAMSADKQRRVVQFCRRGGKVLLVPFIPSFDERYQPCTILADFLGSPKLEHDAGGLARVTIADAVNIHNGWRGAYWTTALPKAAEVIGEDENTGKPLGWRLACDGGGQVIFLGFRWLHTKIEQQQMLTNVLELLGLRRKVRCDNPNVWTSLRTAGGKSVLFLMNLLSSPMTAAVSAWPEWSEEEIDAGTHKLAPMTVKTIDLGG